MASSAPEFDLEHIFTYHAPTDDQVRDYGILRDDAAMFANTICNMVPRGADQSAALRLLREALMTANAGIALGGRLHVEEDPE